MLKVGKKYTFEGRPGASVYHFVGLAQDGKAVMQAKDGLLFDTDQGHRYVEYKEPVVHKWVVTWLKSTRDGSVFPSVRKVVSSKPNYSAMGYEVITEQYISLEEKQ